MSLTKKLIVGTFALASLFGCVSAPEREFPKNHISGVEYGNITQKRVPYKTEEQIFPDSKRFYLQETKQIENSLPFLFYPWGKTSKELDLDSGDMKLIPEEMYLPMKVEINVKNNKYADGVEITNVQANINSIEKLRKKASIPDGKNGYKIVTTEEDATFALPKITILGERYFIMKVEAKKMNEAKKLPYYLVPAKGAKVRIDNACGNLTIYNEDQVYRPVLINSKSLEALAQANTNMAQAKTTFAEDLEAYQQQNPTPLPTAVPTPSPKPTPLPTKKSKN